MIHAWDPASTPNTTSPVPSDITVTITRDVALALCRQANILIHEDQLPGVPAGVWYDIYTDRWTWSLDEATRWAIVALSEGETT